MKISVGASAVGEMKNLKNEHFSYLEELYFTHMGRKNPYTDLMANGMANPSVCRL